MGTRALPAAVALASVIAIAAPRAHADDGWERGQPIPSGYRVEHTGKWAIFGTGLGLFGATYSFCLMATLLDPPPKDAGSYLLAVPGVGPFAALGWYAENGGASKGLALALLADGAFQLTALALVGISLALPGERLERTSIRLSPVGPHGPGLSLGGTF